MKIKSNLKNASWSVKNTFQNEWMKFKSNFCRKVNLLKYTSKLFIISNQIHVAYCSVLNAFWNYCNKFKYTLQVASWSVKNTFQNYCLNSNKIYVVSWSVSWSVENKIQNKCMKFESNYFCKLSCRKYNPKHLHEIQI